MEKKREKLRFYNSSNIPRFVPRLGASFLNLMLSLSGAVKIATAIKISIDARNLDYDKPFGFLATFRSRIHVEEEE